MSEQDVTPQEGMNPEPATEVEVDVTEEDTVESPSEEREEVVPKSQFNQVLARAKKAEAEAKALKSKPAEAPINNPFSAKDAEMIVLKSQGLAPELLMELEALAKVRGKSLIETQSDPIFVAIKDKHEADLKASKAQLGASKGSGTVKKTKGFNTPGLSQDEHKELWKQKMGR